MWVCCKLLFSICLGLVTLKNLTIKLKKILLHFVVIFLYFVLHVSILTQSKNNKQTYNKKIWCFINKRRWFSFYELVIDSRLGIKILNLVTKKKRVITQKQVNAVTIKAKTYPCKEFVFLFYTKISHHIMWDGIYI